MSGAALQPDPTTRIVTALQSLTQSVNALYQLLAKQPLLPPKYSVATLPTGQAQGTMAYATNGRNSGEGAGAGTGCLVAVNSAGVWAAVYSGTAVQA